MPKVRVIPFFRVDSWVGNHFLPIQNTNFLLVVAHFANFHNLTAICVLVFREMSSFRGFFGKLILRLETLHCSFR